MGFFTLLKSLDELLYEVMSWLVFYPVTLWRPLARPQAMMNQGPYSISTRIVIARRSPPTRSAAQSRS